MSAQMERPPSLVNHNCQFCQAKNARLQVKPDLKFRPTTLKQRILLDIGYRTYGREADWKLPLPESLIDKIKAIHEELDHWQLRIWRLRDIVHDQRLSTGTIQEPNQIYCFFDQVHWTEHMKIDRPATARMILECLRSYADLDHINAFLLAVVNCQESHIRYFWRHASKQAMVAFFGYPRGIEESENPILFYWILKLRCNQNQNRLAKVLNSMNDYPSLYPISDGAWLNALQFMWPEMVQTQNGNMEIWFWKAMSSAIEGKCFQVFSFVWDQLSIEQRFQMASDDDYLLWKKAVENGHGGISAKMWDLIDRDIALEKAIKPFYSAVKGGHRQMVDNLWNAMNDHHRNTVLNQHLDIFSVAVEAKCFQSALTFWNAMDSARRTWILDNHPKAFSKAAEFGNMDLVTVMWEHATKFQQFRLVFEDGCASFRKSCTNGHVEIVQLLWEWASLDQRRHMLAQCRGEALSSAFQNGRIQVVQFLWQNMHSEVIVEMVEESYVDKQALSSFLCGACSIRNPSDQLDMEKVLCNLYDHHRISFSSPTSKSVLLNALLWKEEAALKILLSRAEKTGRWEGIAALLLVFDAKQKAQLRPKMTDNQAEKCGLAAMQNSGAPTEENVEAEDKNEYEDDDDDLDYDYYDLGADEV